MQHQNCPCLCRPEQKQPEAVAVGQAGFGITRSSILYNVNLSDGVFTEIGKIQTASGEDARLVVLSYQPCFNKLVGVGQLPDPVTGLYTWRFMRVNPLSGVIMHETNVVFPALPAFVAVQDVCFFPRNLNVMYLSAATESGQKKYIFKLDLRIAPLAAQLLFTGPDSTQVDGAGGGLSAAGNGRLVYLTNSVCYSVSRRDGSYTTAPGAKTKGLPSCSALSEKDAKLNMYYALAETSQTAFWKALYIANISNDATIQSVTQIGQQLPDFPLRSLAVRRKCSCC